MWTIPNILTIGRMALLPVMVALFFLPFAWAAWTCLGLYIIGAVTDFLDGWIARRFNLQSEFGAMIDPISDKVFVVTIMLMLVAVGRIDGLMVLSVVIIIVREFTVSGMREYLGPKGVKLPVTRLAKWKTTLQMAALGFLIVGPYVFLATLIGNITLAGAAVLTLITGWGYVKTGMDFIRKMP
ncbi:MAG: CDP-diacylglycerol--glycerol-3-phosphate 3-phosphatidyltransferase [Rhodospirillales bacterium]|nr:CDP-diacylglycerol--glycerol-3-phosphate 3-phosphatidyltransferase [Alphaproteobacteria bacterium]USO06712.1 MAG: CDP-diacylglycerol--glycerol-3-phosphate 3-phosphatidyltransferase [Rhodospirillales bacterium]